MDMRNKFKIDFQFYYRTSFRAENGGIHSYKLQCMISEMIYI